MAKIFIDTAAGFCPGVQKAIKESFTFAADNQGVVSYGDLIHNPQVLEQLKKAGIQSTDDLNSLQQSDKVIIRAHGIPPAAEALIKAKKLEFLDLTCSIVKRIHKTIRQHQEEDYQIILVGNPQHPETIGHMGYAGKQGCVIENMEQAEAIKPGEKCLVLAQTTSAELLFKKIVKTLKEKSPVVKIENTICPFVIDRQHWIEEYSCRCDAALIIGGKKSSNTGKLYEIAARNCDAFWIESPEELDVESMVTYEDIALTAGTSTPEEPVNRVLAQLHQHKAFLIFIS